MREQIIRKLVGLSAFCEAQHGLWIELADKPGSVVDSHLSGTFVAERLEQPTRAWCGSHL